MSATILLIDDDPVLLSTMERSLHNRFDIVTANGGVSAVELVKSSKPFAVAVCDMRMPGLNGIETLQRIKQLSPNTARLMLTGNVDQDTAIEAVNSGEVFRFYTKPCPTDKLTKGIEEGIKHNRTLIVEQQVLKQTVAGSVHFLTEVLSLAAPEAFGKAERIRIWMRKLIKEYSPPDSWQLDLAAMLFPIGQICLPPELMANILAHGAHTLGEKKFLRELPMTARDLIQHIPRLGPVADIIYYQDKCFDGRGFPEDPVSGPDIPFGARVLKVLKDLSAIDESIWPSSAAFEKISQNLGTYDPEVLADIQKCLEVPGDMLEEATAFVELPISLLREGHVLKEDIVLQNGALLLPSGTELTPILLQRLSNWAKVETIAEPVKILRMGS